MSRPKRPRGREERNVQMGARFRGTSVLDGVLVLSDQRVLSTRRADSSTRNGSAERGGGCSRRPRSEDGRNPRRSTVAVGENDLGLSPARTVRGPARDRTDGREDSVLKTCSLFWNSLFRF